MMLAQKQSIYVEKRIKDKVLEMFFDAYIFYNRKH
jgi:hypothetical protein